MKNFNTTTIPMIHRRLEGDIEIVPIADVHIGSAECHMKAVEHVLDYVMAEPNRYVTLGGDLTDNTIKSSKGSIYESTMSPNEQIATVVELLTPLAEADRILCAVDGNHEQRTFREVDLSPTRIIMLELGLVDLWRRDAAYLYLDLGEGRGGGRGKRRPRYSVAVHHGASNGLTMGAGLNKNKPFTRAMNVDLLITGHTHQPTSGTLIRYEPDLGARAMVPRVSKILIGTGWLTYGGYGATKMYDPLPIAPNKALLSGQEHQIVVVQY